MNRSGVFVQSRRRFPGPALFPCRLFSLFPCTFGWQRYPSGMMSFDCIVLGGFDLWAPRKIANSLDLDKIWIRIESLDFFMGHGAARLLGRTATGRKTPGEEAGPQATVGIYSLGIIPPIA